MIPDDRPADASRPEETGAERAYGGWVRVDPDNLIRGWVTDRSDRRFRTKVEVLIDGDPVATCAADRFDPKLLELGEGDGRYAFALVIPAGYRDGQPHTFDARVPDGSRFRLKSKRATFEVSAAASPPAITVAEANWTLARGRLTGGQYRDGVKLELWRGSDRVADDLAPERTGDPSLGAFTVRLPPTAVEGEGGARAVLAAPGMVEAGLRGAELPLPTGLRAERRRDGLLTVALQGPGGLIADVAELRIRTGDGRMVLARPVRFDEGPVTVDLPDALIDAPVRVGLAIDGYEPAVLSAEPRFTAGRLILNGAFQAWEGRRPRGWTGAADDQELVRGFNAFPARVAESLGAPGDFVHVAAPATVDGGPVVVLRRTLAHRLLDPDETPAAVLVRASAPATFRLRVVEDGRERAGFDVEAPRPWTWVYADRRLNLPPLGPGAVLELAATALEAAAQLQVDVAGLRLGEGGFSDAPSASGVAARVVREHVENAALSDWPHGLTIRAGLGRTEAARGWFVANRRSPDPVVARAWTLEDTSDRVGLLWAGEGSGGACRLEVRLDAEAMRRFGRGVLRFEAGSPAVARRLLADAAANAPEFAVIDRITLVRRTSRQIDGRLSIRDAALAMPARRVLLTREMNAFEFPVELGTETPADLGDPLDADDVEHFVVLQIAPPFAAAFVGLSLTAEPARRAVEPPYLALEDRNVAAQAGSTLGLESWTAGPAIAAASEGVAERSTRLRWRPGGAALGTIEVVVCVHNAPDETLACLRSLTESTTIPHTVHVIDDASDPVVAGRLDAFMEGRPWMRLTRHAENLGYTRSADEGVRGAPADWVVLLNSDTVVTAGWLEGLQAAAASDPAVAFVGPVSNAATFQSVPEVYGADKAFAVNALPAGWSPADMAAYVAEHADRGFPETPLLNGFCTMIRRSAFLEIGGFNAAAFPSGYGEENDLCTRAVKAGYKLVIADHVYIHHVKSASFGGERRAELARAGGVALRALHPDVDFAALTARFRELPALVRLRAAVRRAYGAG